MRAAGRERRGQPGAHTAEEGILRQEGMPSLSYRLRIPEEIKDKNYG